MRYPYICHMPENFQYQQLFTFAKKIFLKIGCSDRDAEIACTTLLKADLRGVDSHCVARLNGYV